MSWSKYVSIAAARSTRSGSVNHWYSAPMMVAIDLEGDLVDVHILADPPLRLLVDEQRADELPRRLVALDEEVVQRIIRVEALDAEDEVEPGEDGGLDIVATDVAQARKRQLQRKGGARIDSVHAVALGDDLAQQSFFRTEVVEEPRGGHPHPVRQRRHPGAAVALRGEELDRRVNDLLAPQVTSGLATVLVGTRVLAERSAAASWEPWSLRSILGVTGHGVIGLRIGARRQKGSRVPSGLEGSVGLEHQVSAPNRSDGA